MDGSTIRVGGASVASGKVGCGIGGIVLIAITSRVGHIVVVAGKTGRSRMGRAGRLVHESSKHNAAGAIPNERRSKLIMLPTRSIHWVRSGAIDLLVGGDRFESSITDRSGVRIAQIDGEFFGVRRASGKTKVDTLDGARRYTSGQQFGCGIDSLVGRVAV